MQIQITPHKDKSQTEITVNATADEFKPYIERAARELTKDRPLKGFRPGKAPLDVVIDAFGKERVLSEALDKALPHFFVQAVLENDIEALGQPATTINELSIEKGLSFTSRVDVLPEVTLGDAIKISVERHKTEVTDEDIKKELQYLAKMRSTFLEVARPAQKGDTAVIDFKVSINGSVIPGGESKNHPVHIGEGHFVPGFEEKLEGIQANDEREFTISFPSDFGQESLRGKEANVWVKAHAIQKRVTPDINDEFAKQLGKFESLANLEAEIRKNMQAEKEQHETDRLQGELATKLSEISTFSPIPETLINREIDHRIEEFASMLAFQQKTIDDYLKQQNKTIEDMRKEMKDSAERNVKVALVLRNFADAQKIEAGEEEIEVEVQNYLARFKSPEDARKHVDQEDLKANITNTIRNQKALKKLEEMAAVK